MSQHDITISPNAAELYRRVADFIEDVARDAISTRGIFHWVLSGGRTPIGVYRELRKPERSNRVDWQKVEFYWGDERCVGSEHPESNFGTAREELLDFLDVRHGQIHRIRGDIDPQQAVVQYAKDLLRMFGNDSDWPTFDLVMLGMGVDGHTASLFPDSDALDEDQRWALRAEAPGSDTERITMTLPAFNHARVVAIVVSGPAKAMTLDHVLSNDTDLPIGRVSPKKGKLKWFVDEPAMTSN